MRIAIGLGVWLVASCNTPVSDGEDTDLGLDTEASVDHGSDDNGGDDTDRSTCEAKADYGAIPVSASVEVGAGRPACQRE